MPVAGAASVLVLLLLSSLVSPKRESASLPPNRESVGEPGASTVPFTALEFSSMGSWMTPFVKMPLGRGSSLLSLENVPLVIGCTSTVSGIGSDERGLVSNADIWLPLP